MSRPKQLALRAARAEGAELLSREMFMASRLKLHGYDVFAGSCDTASRKACFRRVLTTAGIELSIIGKDSNGKCLTYAQAFERTYGEPLSGPRRRSKPDHVPTTAPKEM